MWCCTAWCKHIKVSAKTEWMTCWRMPRVTLKVQFIFIGLQAPFSRKQACLEFTLLRRPEDVINGGRLRLKCDGTRAETRFRLFKWTSPFKPVGASVQSTTGRRGVRISGSNAGYTMFRGSVKSTGYPLHLPVSPSLPLLCVTVCHHISTGIYDVVIGNRVVVSVHVTYPSHCDLCQPVLSTSRHWVLFLIIITNNPV
jgi:hypothetical protein